MKKNELRNEFHKFFYKLNNMFVDSLRVTNLHGAQSPYTLYMYIHRFIHIGIYCTL